MSEGKVLTILATLIVLFLYSLMYGVVQTSIKSKECRDKGGVYLKTVCVRVEVINMEGNYNGI